MLVAALVDAIACRQRHPSPCVVRLRLVVVRERGLQLLHHFGRHRRIRRRRNRTIEDRLEHPHPSAVRPRRLERQHLLPRVRVRVHRRHRLFFRHPHRNRRRLLLHWFRIPLAVAFRLLLLWRRSGLGLRVRRSCGLLRGPELLFFALRLVPEDRRP